MASASSSAQSAFGLGRRKQAPGLLDQIGKFFGGDKKKKSKGSFRGALSSSPARPTAASPRKRGAENAVVHFFRGIVSPAPPKSRWRGLQAKLGLKSQSAKAKKASPTDGQGTLSKIFKMGGSRSASPAKR
ncbi:myelin basic protein-like isoform X2 [Osmerus eperlanus]|uniref:myelin basic protein-like isoform X2 n=2 Tax=Osmerus eperlanus TaxID=29151 RepID=UPI002E1469A0